MNKKGGKLTRSSEEIYKLAFNKSFRDEVREIRRKAGYPIGGFADEKQEGEFLKARSESFERLVNKDSNGKINRKTSQSYCLSVGSIGLMEEMELLKKYKLPATYYLKMRQYLRYDRFDSLEDYEEETLHMRYPDDKGHSRAGEKTCDKLKIPYVGIYIFDASSKDRVIRIINKKWSEIRRSLKMQGCNVNKIRASDNKARNLLISDLCQKSREEMYSLMREKTPDKIPNKEYVVASLMNYLGYKEVTIDMVKKYWLTQKNSPTYKSQLKRKYI